MSFLAGTLSEAVTAALPTFGGAVDVIAVRQPDACIRCSEFHARFGQYLGLVGRKPDAVQLFVNGSPQPTRLRLARTGTVFFADSDDPSDLDESGFSSPQQSSVLPRSYSGTSDAEHLLHEQHHASTVPDDLQVIPSPEYHSHNQPPPHLDPSYAHVDSSGMSPRSSARPSWLWRVIGSRISEQQQQKVAPAARHSSHQQHSLQEQRAEDDRECEGEHVHLSLHESVRVNMQPEPCNPGCLRCGSRLEQQASSARSSVAGVIPGLESIPDIGLELSLCGSLEAYNEEDAHIYFENSRISATTFASKPHKIAEDRRLMCRLSGKIYPWREVVPAVLGLLAYGPMQQSTNERSDDKLAGGEAAAAASAGDALSTVSASTSGAATGRLTPTSEELASMPLEPGRNELVFRYESPGGNKQDLHARLYLWHWSDKLVISDVDGTITRSDLMGHVMPALGRDWSHAGVAALYKRIANHQYRLVFLSSRGVGMSYRTRNYLETLKQGTETLPDGPVIVAPDTLTTALYREIVRGSPHEFKIEALDKLRNLFPENVSPFFAGFGNRESDQRSYEYIGMPGERIFTINPQGRVNTRDRSDGSKVTTSLSTIREHIDTFFPANPHEPAMHSHFTTATFWKSEPYLDALTEIESATSLSI